MTFPRSAHDTTLGLVYFARMLDKIRLLKRGELPEDYLPMLGEGFDGRICRSFSITTTSTRAAGNRAPPETGREGKGMRPAARVKTGHCG